MAAKYLRPSNRTVGFFVPTDKAERTPVPAVPEVATLVEGYKGREVGGQGESFDVAPGAIEARVRGPSRSRGSSSPCSPRRPGTRSSTSADPALRRRREPQGLGPGRRLPPRADDAGDDEDHPAADPGHARQEPRPALRRAGGRLGGLMPGRGPRRSVRDRGARRSSPRCWRCSARSSASPPCRPTNSRSSRLRDRRHRRGSHRPDPPGLESQPRLISTLPDDDVRYIPTLDEEIERAKALARSAPHPLQRVSRRRPRRAGGRRRLRPLRDPPDLGQGAGCVEGPASLTRGSSGLSARPEGGARDDQDPRQGERRLPGGLSRRSRTAPRLPGPHGAISSWAAARSSSRSPIDSGRRRACPTAMSASRPTLRAARPL